MRVDDFDYELPEELIAQTPLLNRSDSRLMVVDPVTQSIQHHIFRDIVEFVRPGDVLVLNNSKVIPARLYGVKADTGARIELLLIQKLSETEWVTLAKPAKRLRPGTVIYFYPGARKFESFSDSGTVGQQETDVPLPKTAQPAGQAVVIDAMEDGMRLVRFEVSQPMEAFLDLVGVMPLPPYIHAPLLNPNRYQTVYAKHAGSVAAPTAGLHFTEEVLSSLRERGVFTTFVTLHVGLGTFRPVQVDSVEEHHMHSETYEVSPETAALVNKVKDGGGRVIAVGTTAMRTLESATVDGRLVAMSGDTDIFIYPGYQMRITDSLITNFHLPKSTLLMLVSAFMGVEFTLHVYREAVKERYRFFSFGDAMFIQRKVSP